jgi:hypothetical protein
MRADWGQREQQIGIGGTLGIRVATALRVLLTLTLRNNKIATIRTLTLSWKVQFAKIIVCGEPALVYFGSANQTPHAT